MHFAEPGGHWCADQRPPGLAATWRGGGHLALIILWMSGLRQ